MEGAVAVGGARWPGDISSSDSEPAVGGLGGGGGGTGRAVKQSAIFRAFIEAGLSQEAGGGGGARSDKAVGPVLAWAWGGGGGAGRSKSVNRLIVTD